MLRLRNTLSEAAMKLRRVVLPAIAILMIFGMCSTISGKDKAAKGAKNPIGPMPSMFNQQLDAMGRRLKVSGKEKTVFRGQFFDKAGNSSPVLVIHQLPDMVRLEGFKAENSALSFNGVRGIGIKNKSDEILIEAFLLDVPEWMFASAQRGAAVQLLGRRIGPDPRLHPNYSGPRYDIFEVTYPVINSKDKILRSKRYYFDSQTGLLQSTRYYDRSVSPPIRIETRFSLWGEIDGSAYPARIEHYEGGQLVFTFIAETIEGGESLDKSNF
jgi:hypothetical protein